MVLATLLLLCAVPQADDTAKAASTAASPEDASKPASQDLRAASELPSAPQPKPEANPAAVHPTAEPFHPTTALAQPYETPTQRKMWYALTLVGSGGAVFDAWSTRRAISAGAGQEADPFLRPFAHSNFLYAATQVSPALMDFLGKRFMTSEHRWVRKIWWLPQAAGGSFSFVAGAHNVSVVH